MAFSAASQPKSDLKKSMSFCLFYMATWKSKNVMQQVLEMGTPKRDAKKTFLEYLLLEKQICMLEIRKIFNQSQRKKIGMCLKNDFDVNLLYLCIQYGCDGLAPPKDRRWQKEMNALEYCVTSIKNFRNTTLHMVDIDENTFMEKADELRDLLKNALEKAYEFYRKQNVPLHILQEIDQEIDDVKNDPSSKVDDGIFLFNKLCEMVKVEGKNELKKKYETMSSIGPVSNLLGRNRKIKVHMDKIFTKMLIKKESHSSEDQDEYVEYEELLQCVQKRQGHKDNVVLLVEGPAGVGKTTLTRKIICDWASGKMAMKSISNYEFAILAECRDSTISSLGQLLSSLMPELSKNASKEDLVKCIQENKLLFIIDGLDELNPSSKNVVKEILNLGENVDVTVICTTRPNRISDFKQEVPENFAIMHMKVMGIEESRREEFVINYSRALDDVGQRDISGLLQYLKESRLHDHWKLAFNLVLVTILWFLDPDAVNKLTTATELLMETHELCIKRLKQRLLEHKETRTLDAQEVNDKVDIFLNKLQEEALINHYKDETVLSAASVERLKDVCDCLSLPHAEALGSFLIQADSVTGDGKEKFSFPHKGLQDFFSALHVRETLLAKEIDIRRILSNIETILSDCNVPSELSKALLGVNKEELKKQNRKISKISHSIRSVLEETLDMAKAYDETESQTVSLDLVKCQNILFHLTGLLYVGERSLKQDACAELVSLLRDSGINNRSEWLSLLSEVKCDETVSKCIAQAMDLKERIEITDSQVTAYASVLSHARPSHVEIDISGDPQDVPRIKDLLCTLRAKSWKTDLRFQHDFRHMKGRASTLDETLQEFLKSSKAKLTWFNGRLSGPAVKELPKSVEFLELAVEDDAHYADLRPLLAQHSKKLEWLGLHVAADINAAQLRPLPEVSRVNLIVSGVTESTVERACRVARALQPKKKGYFSLAFPDVLSAGGACELLVERLAGEQVKVTGAVRASPSTSPEEQERQERLDAFTRGTLGCFFAVLGDEIWDQKPMDVLRDFNLQRYRDEF
ncbi:uncharacterized protein LOC134771603 [Penaeus indicus]|uniref:uncharacterized protein LOC134771603 n=1 Tax=Penaeus indicus TaxID=29960 RepID=UPI00300CAC9E